MDDEADDLRWTLDALRMDGADPDVVPNLATTARLVGAYRDTWVEDGVGLRDLLPWMCERLELDVQRFEWKRFACAVKMEHYRMTRLKFYLSTHKVTSGDLPKKLREASTVVYSLNQLAMQATRMLALLTVDADMVQAPPEEDDEDGAREDEEENNVLHADQVKLTNFQSAFCRLRVVLEGCHYRRADGKFFRRIVTAGGLETLAFEEAISVEGFVTRHTSHEIDFRAWRWITDPPANVERMVDYMTRRSLPEAPELVEDRHLFSYAGDAAGRGAGVYDASSDAFFPYHCRQAWADMARNYTRERKDLVRARRYVCEAPSVSSVCVSHLTTAFPYDVYAETLEAMRLPCGTRWREAEAFECAPGHALVVPACSGGGAAALAAVLAARLAPDAEEPEVWGLSWQPLPPEATLDARAWTELAAGPGAEELRTHLAAGRAMFFTDEEGVAEMLRGVGEHTFVRAADGACYVPLGTPARRARTTLSAAERAALLPAAGVPPRAWVRHDDGDGAPPRYFLPDTGRTWRDCEAKEIDHIFACQKFSTHDCWYLYAGLGRLFYAVHTFDRCEFTVMIEGIGGCGKSTIVKAQMRFHPPHLRGVLSANQQPQFGMSSVAKKGKALVAYCSEMTENPNIVQEEWQNANSREQMSLAVKHEAPLELEWTAPIMFVGNRFPSMWKNSQGQVSRRLFGVMMAQAVQGRDGRILEKIFRTLGALQRKEVLAYFAFVESIGSTDVMSHVDRLPPAFADYYRRGRRATEPLVDFLSDEQYVVVEEGATMLLASFRELFGRYRIDKELGKMAKWSEDVYRTPFSERGILVQRKESVVIDGVEHRTVDVVYNVRAAAL